jgi:hypothetical protein
VRCFCFGLIGQAHAVSGSQARVAHMPSEGDTWACPSRLMEAWRQVGIRMLISKLWRNTQAAAGPALSALFVMAGDACRVGGDLVTGEPEGQQMSPGRSNSAHVCALMDWVLARFGKPAQGLRSGSKPPCWRPQRGSASIARFRSAHVLQTHHNSQVCAWFVERGGGETLTCAFRFVAASTCCWDVVGCRMS